MTLKMGEDIAVPFVINATDLSAGTTQEIVSPIDGYVDELQTIVQTAIVTGGAITVKVGTTDVDGLSITVADSATKGTVQSDKATPRHASRKVAKGGRIQIVPAAAFNGGGAVSGNLIIKTGF